MIVTKTEYGLTIIVWHKSGGQICAVSFESDRPFAAMHAGHGVKLAEIEGFEESRLVIGKVAKCTMPSRAVAWLNITRPFTSIRAIEAHLGDNASINDIAPSQKIVATHLRLRCCRKK